MSLPWLRKRESKAPYSIGPFSFEAGANALHRVKTVPVVSIAVLPERPTFHVEAKPTPQYRDRFAFKCRQLSPYAFELEVKREDAPVGWGQELIIIWRADGRVPEAEAEQGAFPPLLPLSRNPSFVITQQWEEDAISRRSYSTDMWPEFRAVVDQMIITPHILATTSTSAQAAVSLLQSVPLTEPFESTLAGAISAAFHLPSAADAINYRIHNANGLGIIEPWHNPCVYSEVLLTYHALDALDKAQLHAALTVLTQCQPDDDDSSALPVVLLYLTRAARECKARKREAMLVAVRAITPVPPQQTAHQHDQAPRSEVEEARQLLYDVIVAHIDDIKEKAFRTVFLEPTKLYFHAIGDYTSEADVDIHGRNAYVGLVNGLLGVRLPVTVALLHDHPAKAFASFLNAFPQTLVQVLWDGTSLGKSWGEVLQTHKIPLWDVRATITSYDAKDRFYVPPTGGLGQFFYAVHLSEAAAARSSTGPQRRAIADYLHAFAYFFSTDFILEELCKKVDNSVELEVPVRVVLQAQGVNVHHTPLLLQHVYHGDQHAFSHDRARSFLSALGICTPATATAANDDKS